MPPYTLLVYPTLCICLPYTLCRWSFFPSSRVYTQYEHLLHAPSVWDVHF